MSLPVGLRRHCVVSRRCVSHPRRPRLRPASPSAKRPAGADPRALHISHGARGHVPHVCPAGRVRAGGARGRLGRSRARGRPLVLAGGLDLLPHGRGASTSDLRRAVTPLIVGNWWHSRRLPRATSECSSFTLTKAQGNSRTRGHLLVGGSQPEPALAADGRAGGSWAAPEARRQPEWIRERGEGWLEATGAERLPRMLLDRGPTLPARSESSLK